MVSPLDGKKILVVDDEEMIRDLLKNIFTSEGAQVSTAENGSKAFHLVQQGIFDALITDVRMPGGDGLTLIENIRSQLKRHPLFFVCSGFNDFGERSAAGLDIVRIFEKPFNLRELIGEVRTALLTTQP